MKKVACTAIILITASTLSYGKCKSSSVKMPTVPDGEVATLQEMLDAKANVTHYIDTTKKYVACTKNHNYRRAERAMKKMRKLVKSFNKANKLFSEQVAKNTPNQLVAQK